MGVLRDRRKLEEGWSSFLITLLMLLTVTWSVAASDWTPGLELLPWIVLVGAPICLLLARWRGLPGILIHLLALCIGVIGATLAVNLVLKPPLVPAAFTSSAPDLWARSRMLYQQAWDWLRQPASAEAWLSNLMFVLTLAHLASFLTYLSVWSVFRLHWAWGAVVPAGLACLVNVYYAPPSASIYLIAFCLCALLLVVRVHVHRREATWRRAEVAYNLDVDLAFLRDGLLVSAVAVLLAWSVPAAARSPRLMSFWENFQEPGQRLRTVWNRMFTSLNYQGPSALVDFGRTMTLGGAVNLGSVAVLEVQADEPHYWRAVYYDLYTGSGWNNTDPVSLAIAPGSTQLRPAVYAAQQELTTTVRMLVPGESVLFAPGQTLRSSVGARVTLSYVPGASAMTTEVSMMTTPATLRRNQTYALTSLVSHASASELRVAGEDYPAWVTDRYLQLPARLPQRVRSLARELTAGIGSPYERAEAIQSYLRRIPYDQSISAPPAGVEVVDWFVFVNRRGYCDYYATAMAVLCRAVGIPARVAQGYTAGEYLPDVRAYRVYQLDAHAWPELYFPRYGWLPFEPTSSEPAIVRPDAEGAATIPSLLPPGTSERSQDEDKYGPDEALGPDEEVADVVLARSRSWYMTALRLGGTLAGLVAVFGLLAIAVWHLSLRGFDQAGRVWEQVRRMGGLIGVPQPVYLTPGEYGEALGARVTEGAEDIKGIVRLYTQHRFSHTGWTAEKQVELHTRWAKLRPLLLRRIMRPKWERRRKTADTWVPASSLRPPSMLA